MNSFVRQAWIFLFALLYTFGVVAETMAVTASEKQCLSDNQSASFIDELIIGDYSDHFDQIDLETKVLKEGGKRESSQKDKKSPYTILIIDQNRFSKSNTPVFYELSTPTIGFSVGDIIFPFHYFW